MHILIVADGRSPIARRWMQSVLAGGHEITLVSTYPCEPPPGVQQTFVLPVAFAGLASGPGGSGQGGAASPLKRAVKRFRAAFLAGRYRFGPLTVPSYGRRFRKLIETVQPDLVHALRIPFEGMLASYTPRNYPLAVTVWGNDLTLHAPMSASMRKLTQQTLARADGLVTDAQRDVRLARAWGFPENRPTLVVPGNGGIDLAEIHRPCDPADAVPLDPIPADAPLIINPRGIRPAYARTDVFFQAVPLVLAHRPDVHFLCAGMAGQVESEQWIRRLKIDRNVHLLPHLPQAQLWELFRRCDVTSSVTTHDGTPNTLLEAMACGAFPVAGDIESLREWITPGVNGLLVEPNKPQAVAEAFLLALENPELRRKAAEINLELIRQRAEISQVRAQLEVFYQWVWGLR